MATMTRRQSLFLLIFIMVVMPVASAFGYYSGIASQLSVESSFTYAVAATNLNNDSGLAATHDSDQCHQLHKIRTVCHISSTCSFHICGDGGITADFLFVQEYGSYRYEQTEKPPSAPFHSPPISSLPYVASGNVLKSWCEAQLPGPMQLRRS